MTNTNEYHYIYPWLVISLLKYIRTHIHHVAIYMYNYVSIWYEWPTFSLWTILNCFIKTFSSSWFFGSFWGNVVLLSAFNQKNILEREGEGWSNYEDRPCSLITIRGYHHIYTHIHDTYIFKWFSWKGKQ